jgi:hypothetical protein
MLQRLHFVRERLGAALRRSHRGRYVARASVVAGWNPERRRAIGTLRGCALMLALPDLFVVSPGLAQEQWTHARRRLVRTVQGVTGVREYPDPIDLPATTDSGRILFGLGEAASGFGLAAAAAAEDMVVLAALLRSARRVAPPTWQGDELVLRTCLPLGKPLSFAPRCGARRRPLLPGERRRALQSGRVENRSRPSSASRRELSPSLKTKEAAKRVRRGPRASLSARSARGRRPTRCSNHRSIRRCPSRRQCH